MGYVVTSKRETRIRSRLANAYRATAQLAPLLGVLTLSFVAGCTAILDIDKEQCSVTADCTDLFGPTAPYLCTDHICERPACNTDAECRAKGDAFATSICDGNHLCAPAECTDNSQCGVGVCDLTKNKCANRECDTTEDCMLKSPSPTVQCTQGFCVDETWGCIGQPDERPLSSESGTIVVKLLTSDTKEPVAGANWQIKVCGQPQIDPNCQLPVMGQTTQYDPATGTATISGLSYDRPIRLQFDELALKEPTGESKYIPMDFYTQRPPVGVTEVPALRVVSRAGLAALVASFSNVTDEMGISQAVNPDLGNVYGLIFDCQGRPAANVALSYTNAIRAELKPKPVVLYWSDQIPVLTSLFSFPSGVISTLNISLENITVVTTLVATTTVNPTTGVITPVKTRVIRNDYTMLLAKSRLTTVHFYPRNYGN